MQLISLKDASVDFTILDIEQWFNVPLEVIWAHSYGEQVLGYDQNILRDGILITLQNVLLYYSSPCHCPIFVECLEVDCKIEYTNAIQGIQPECCNIWVQWAQWEENLLNNTVQGQISTLQVLYFSWTPPNQILQ